MSDRETHLDETEGLWIPPDLREFTAQVVFRTPRTTIQHFESGGGHLDPYYGMISESDFGDPDEMRDPKNADLAPNRVRIKPQGEEPVELTVNLDGVVADGGRSVGDSERCDTCNGSLQIWDDGWTTCPDCFDDRNSEPESEQSGGDA